MIRMILRIRIFYPCPGWIIFLRQLTWNMILEPVTHWDAGQVNPDLSTFGLLKPGGQLRQKSSADVKYTLYVASLTFGVACVYSNYNCIYIYFNERIWLSVNLCAYCLFVYIYLKKKISVYICIYIYISLCTYMYMHLCLYLYLYLYL